MPFDILENDGNKPFKIRGIFMRKNSLSRNGRYYSDKIVEKTVQSMKDIIEGKGYYPISMMADHPGVASNKTLSTVGKITNVFIDGDNAILEAEIANTTLGRDVQELIRGSFVEGLSIRASNGKFKKRYIDGKLVNDVLEMEIKGVDIVVNPGVDGMRITDIIESDQTDSSNIYISISEEEEIVKKIDEEEEQLELIKAKLSDLKEMRPDLVESLKNELRSVFESEFKVSDLTESVEALENEKNTLQESYDALVQEKETVESELEAVKASLTEAQNELEQIKESEAKAKREAHIESKMASVQFADYVKDRLRSKLEVCESIEDIDAVFESEVDFLETVIKESTGVDIKSKGHTGENATEVNEDEDFINKVMGL